MSWEFIVSVSPRRLTPFAMLLAAMGLVLVFVLASVGKTRSPSASGSLGPVKSKIVDTSSRGARR